ncbi:hypothetical protein ACLOJK_031192 [Asimina triloba]
MGVVVIILGRREVEVYFGVSTLLDATSSDGLKAEEEQKEVNFHSSTDLWLTFVPYFLVVQKQT